MQFEDKISAPCHIVLTRIAPRFFDYDNLVTDFKAIRDEVAAYIMQDYVPGRADGSKELTWEYTQEKNVRGDPQRYKIKIGIFKREIIK